MKTVAVDLVAFWQQCKKYFKGELLDHQIHCIDVLSEKELPIRFRIAFAEKTNKKGEKIVTNGIRVDNIDSDTLFYISEHNECKTSCAVFMDEISELINYIKKGITEADRINISGYKPGKFFEFSGYSMTKDKIDGHDVVVLLKQYADMYLPVLNIEIGTGLVIFSKYNEDTKEHDIGKIIGEKFKNFIYSFDECDPDEVAIYCAQILQENNVFKLGEQIGSSRLTGVDLELGKYKL